MERLKAKLNTPTWHFFGVMSKGRSSYISSYLIIFLSTYLFQITSTKVIKDIYLVDFLRLYAAEK